MITVKKAVFVGVGGQHGTLALASYPIPSIRSCVVVTVLETYGLP